MREFDKRGLDLAAYQAEIFKQSLIDTESSSPIFIRRFMKSKFVQKLDEGETYLLSLDTNEAFASLDKQYGKSVYGKIKYSINEIHWIGYIYRYICYTRECPSRLIYKLIKPAELRNVYFAYHTQSEEWVIASLLEANHLSEEDLNPNIRLKNAIRKRIAS
ncbi:MAG: antitoxin [Bacilli bacterium]|jgi:hypothetical protein|nr:antitoxin [Bacilli bacterium]